MTDSDTTVLKVVDALDHPYGNRILRTRLLRGSPPTVGRLRGAVVWARSREGREAELLVAGFPLFGGAPSDERIRSSGRIDLIVSGGAEASEVSPTWELYLERP